MTDAPKRIWVAEDRENHGEDAFHSTSPFSGGVEYILASEHAALILEADTRTRNDAMIDCINILANLRNEQPTGPIFAVLNEAMERIENARFAAIRAAKATP